MPIRVNLKEIFPSDPQEITVDKVNFNFNKLLELGIGTPGPIGLTGPQGPAGPIGLTGPQGDRGATWWVDSGDPNTLTFTGLIDGDLYLDQDSNAFQVYQYDDSTGTWTPIVSIAAIVNAYLSSLSTIPFETVETIQLGTPPNANKFILFDERSSGSDSIRGTLNTSKNNILFLNNFEEDPAIDSALTSPLGQDQYNSLLAIYPDHSDATLSSNAEVGRYHIELGSLYTTDNAVTKYYSNIKHNLKIKFYKRDLTATGAEFPSTNNWINTARFSLSVTENQTTSDIDENAEFEFLLPKWNNEGMSPIKENLAVRLSSAEAAVEQGPTFNHIVADGIHIAIDPSVTNPLNLNATLGLALDYSSPNSKLNNKTHFMIDTNSGVNGMILLNKSTFINGDANIVQGLSIGAAYKALTAPSNSLIVEGSLGLGISSPDTGVKFHNYLTGSLTSPRIMNFNELENITFSGSAILKIIDNSITNHTSGATTLSIMATALATTGASPNVFSEINGNRLSLSGTNNISGQFRGNYLQFQGTSSINTNFTGAIVDMTGNTQIGSSFIGLNHNLTGTVDISSNYYNILSTLASNVNIDGASYNSRFLVQGPTINGSLFGNSIEVSSSSTLKNVLVNSFSMSGSSTADDVTLNNLQFSSTNDVQSIFGMNIKNTGTLTLTGDFYGNNIDLGSGTTVNHPASGDVYGTRFILTNDSKWPASSISADVFGSEIFLAPDFSLGTGGSPKIYGNRIRLINYRPRTNTEVYGTYIDVTQTNGTFDQGKTTGLYVKTDIDSAASPTQDVIGIKIDMDADLHPNFVYGLVANTTGPMPAGGSFFGVNHVHNGNIPSGGNLYGIRQQVNGDIDSSSNIYALNARYDGTISSGGKAYGMFLSGHTDNYVEGASWFKGSVAISDDPGNVQHMKGVYSGTIAFGWNSISGGQAYYIEPNITSFLYPATFPQGYGSGSNVYIYINHPPIDPSRAVLQVTMKYIGGAAEESLGVVCTTSLGSTTSILYFNNASGGGWGYNAKLRFGYTLILF